MMISVLPGFSSWDRACKGLLVLLSVLVLGALTGTPLHADIASEAGTSGGRFFRVNFGARAHALGEAYTAASDDLFSVQFNPAGPHGIESTQLVAQQTDALLDMQMQYVGLGRFSWGEYELSGFGGFFDKGTLQGAEETSGGAFKRFTGTFSASDYQVGLNVTRALYESVVLGVNLKHLRSSIAGFDASAFGMDAGMRWRPTERLTLGVALENLGQDLQFIEEGDPLPRTMNAGGSYRVRWGQHVSTQTNLDVHKPRGNEVGWALGQEVGLMEMVDFRVGYNSLDTLKEGFSVGAGFEQERFSVDYAFRPSGEFFDARQTFSLQLDF